MAHNCTTTATNKFKMNTTIYKKITNITFYVSKLYLN